MRHQGIFKFASLVLGIAACVIGEKEEGLYFRDEIMNPIKVKLLSIASDCSQKVQFNVQEINGKIASCAELFNTLGETKVDYPDAKYPQSELEDPDTFELEIKAYREARKLNSDQYIKNFCSNQLNPTIQCLEPLKSIFDQCQSSEGISFFSIAEEMCKDDGQPMLDINDALGTCQNSNQRFVYAAVSCEREAGGFRKYHEPMINAEKIADDFCEIGSVLLRCVRRGITAAGPPYCLRLSEEVESFVEGIKSRASNVEALTQCIRQDTNTIS